MPKVSVLLTTWNQPVMLREAIDSVFAQTYDDYELIIMDDNSDDPRNWEVISEYREDPHVVVYKSNVQPDERPKLVRYAVLANLGMRISSGEYVTYLCDDDLYYPRRLEVMAARLDQGDCQVVYGNQRVTRNGMLCEIRSYGPNALMNPSCKVDHSSVMHTLGAAFNAGGWPTDPGLWRQADAAFWTRLVAAGYPFYPVGEITDEHRFHSKSVSESKKFC